MLDWNLLQNMLIIAIFCSTVTVAFVQKTKKFCRNSRCITWYSLLVNVILGFLFTITFTSLDYFKSLWIGLFSFIGADTIYRNLEGKMASYTDLNPKFDDSTMTNTTSLNEPVDVIEEIHYD